MRLSVRLSMDRYIPAYIHVCRRPWSVTRVLVTKLNQTGGNYPVGLPRRAAHSVDNTQLSRHSQSPKILGRPQPPNECQRQARGHCGRKNYTLEVGADQQKILRYWAKYAGFWRIIYSLATFSQVAEKLRVVMAPGLVPFCSAFILDENLMFVCRYAEPFRSYELPIDGDPRKLIP